MIAFVIFILIYSVLDAIHDYCFLADIKIKSYRVWHGVDFIIKGLVITSIGYFVLNPIINSYYDIIWLLYIAGVMRWIIFDLTYNFISGYKWYYVGGGGLDKFFGNWQFYVKAILLLILIYKWGYLQKTKLIKYDKNNTSFTTKKDFT